MRGQFYPAVKTTWTHDEVKAVLIETNLITAALVALLCIILMAVISCTAIHSTLESIPHYTEVQHV